MHIQQIEVYKVPVRLKKPFKISLGSYAYASNVIIVLKTTDGRVGFGECSPFMSIHGESMETAYTVAQYLAKGLIGVSAVETVVNAARMDAIIYGNACIKSAFNIAMYDLAAQYAQQPLYKFLGGANNKQLRTDYTISLDTIDHMLADAAAILEAGFRIIKVKLGGTKEDDVERIRQIRKLVGPDIIIRIDANQGWNVEDASEILEALAPFSIQHCEEPVSRSLYEELPAIRKASKIPVMADESCCDHFDAQRLINIQAVDSFNIKLSKSAGIDKARKIIALAEKHSMDVQLGGFLESRLGFTAAAHVALTSDAIKHVDFDTPLMFQEDPVVGGLVYKEAGLIEVPEAIGLGAVYDPAYLARLEKILIQ